VLSQVPKSGPGAPAEEVGNEDSAEPLRYDSHMRLALKVNDRQAVRASLQESGYLTAHLSLTRDPDKDGISSRVSINAIDMSDEPNSVSSTWEIGSVTIGDRVEILVLPDGDSDPPAEVRRSSKSPKNLFSDGEQARLLLSAVRACDAELMGILNRARSSEPAEEMEKIARAVAGVVCELDRHLITPTLRRHPELLAEAKEKKLV
jgi:hypothetical protein